VLGVSALHSRCWDAEHLLADLLGAVDASGLIACTHLVDWPWRHEAVSAHGPAPVLASLYAAATRRDGVAAVLLDADGATTSAGPDDRRAGAAQAAAEHRGRAAGRAVHYPGQESLVGDVPVADVLAGTAIDAVLSSHGEYAATAVLRTGGFIRPRFEGGRLVLHVGHEDPELLMPWEVAEPTPCCGQDHTLGPLDPLPH
jgi:hypothetical protein